MAVITAMMARNRRSTPLFVSRALMLRPRMPPSTPPTHMAASTSQSKSGTVPRTMVLIKLAAWL